MANEILPCPTKFSTEQYMHAIKALSSQSQTAIFLNYGKQAIPVITNVISRSTLSHQDEQKCHRSGQGKTFLLML